MKKIKISMFLNAVIVLLTIVASIIMFTGIKFMTGPDLVLESTKIGMFKFFTVDSNILMGITSLIFLIYGAKSLKDKRYKTPKKVYLLKLISTTAVTITFLVVFCYLGQISKGGMRSMLLNSNLLFHLFIPVLSIISFIFFERNDKLSAKNALFGILPTLIYGTFYLTNVLIHTQNGKVSPIYDWYWFVQNGVSTAIIVFPMSILLSYAVSLVLWRLNHTR